MAGLVVGELMGTVDSDRVRRAVRRLRRGGDAPVRDPLDVQHDVEAALAANSTTRRLEIMVRGLADGIVELAGLAPDAMARALAGDLARGVPGVDVVVNRILIEGTDVPMSERKPSNAG